MEDVSLPAINIKPQGVQARRPAECTARRSSSGPPGVRPLQHCNAALDFHRSWLFTLHCFSQRLDLPGEHPAHAVGHFVQVPDFHTVLPEDLPGVFHDVLVLPVDQANDPDSLPAEGGSFIRRIGHGLFIPVF